MPALRVRPRFLGINKKRDTSEVTSRHASDALNVQLDNGTLKKRDGYTEVTDIGSSAILGMFDFRRSDGSVDTLIKHGDTMYVRDNDADTDTSLASSLSATELADFAVHSDRCYFVDGTNLKITDGTSGNTRDAEITRPGSGTTVAAQGTGILRGTYDYKVTFYNGTDGHESPASDATSTVTINDEQIRLSSIPTGASHVTARRIYRRKVSGSEVNWFYVHEIADNSTTQWDDNTLDVDVSATDIAPLSYSSSLPGFRYLEQHSGIMFLAGDDDQLYFTMAGRPWSVTDSIRVGGEGAVGKITGLKSFQGLLVIFKEDSIWTLSGVSVETFSTRKILAGVGCQGGHTIVPVGNLLYFLGEDAFYVFDGSRAAMISDPLQTDLIDRNRSRDKYAVGVHDEENQSIIWSWTTSGGSANNQVSTFFYGNTNKYNMTAGDEPDQSWCPWSFDAGLTSCARVTTGATARDRKVWYGFANGVVGEPGGSSDNTTAIEFKWRTGKWDGDSPEMMKNWGELQVELKKQTNYSHLEVRHYRDDDSTHEQIAVLDSQEQIHDLLVSDYSRDLRLEFYQNASEPVEVVSFVLQADLAGRA